MVKNLTGKKTSYVYDELGYTGGGLYCFTPYDGLDSEGKSLFKVGMCMKFRSRFEDYYTAFPNGVYITALLEDPQKHRITVGTRNSKPTSTTIKVYYKLVEKFIADNIIEDGGKRIFTKTRIKNSSKNEGKGETEWFYCSEETIWKAFIAAKDKYGGRLDNFENHINRSAANELKSNKEKFVGRIITFV